MDKSAELEEKIHRLLELHGRLKRENEHLRSECETLKSHVAMLTTENSKAQRILAEHEDLRHTQAQVTHRVERALEKLTTLGHS